MRFAVCRQAKTGQEISGYRGTAQEHATSVNDDLLLELKKEKINKYITLPSYV